MNRAVVPSAKRKELNFLMTHEKILGIVAWAFTLAAIVLAVMTAIVHRGALACTTMMTMALAAKCIYGRALKRREKNLGEVHKMSRVFGRRHSTGENFEDGEDNKDNKNDIWEKRYYGK